MARARPDLVYIKFTWASNIHNRIHMSHRRASPGAVVYIRDGYNPYIRPTTNDGTYSTTALHLQHNRGYTYSCRDLESHSY